MATIAVIGDGPAGLSAALFLARNGQQAIVYAQDETAMHHALLRNYLGIEQQTGTDFQQVARQQVLDAGAQIVEDRVTDLARDGERFVVTTEAGRQDEADHLVLATSKKGVELARQLGVETTTDGIDVDTEYRTPVDRVYAVGRLARPHRSQAVISAGAGAIAALDILSREAGKDVHDWDTPDDA
jgi:thioredoxin reductase (NADPH)